MNIFEGVRHGPRTRSILVHGPCLIQILAMICIIPNLDRKPGFLDSEILTYMG